MNPVPRLAAVGLVAVVAPAGDHAARAYDFNGDGRQDLAAGAPGWMDAASGRGGGAVVVLPGSRRGARLAARRFFAPPLGRVPGHPPFPRGVGAAVARAH